MNLLGGCKYNIYTMTAIFARYWILSALLMLTTSPFDNSIPVCLYLTGIRGIFITFIYPIHIFLSQWHFFLSQWHFFFFIPMTFFFYPNDIFFIPMTYIYPNEMCFNQLFEGVILDNTPSVLCACIFGCSWNHPAVLYICVINSLHLWFLIFQ